MAVSFLICIDNGALLSGRPQVTPTTCYILPKQTLPVIGTLLYHLEIAEDSFITQLKKENEKALE